MAQTIITFSLRLMTVSHSLPCVRLKDDLLNCYDDIYSQSVSRQVASRSVRRSAGTAKQSAVSWPPGFTCRSHSESKPVIQLINHSVGQSASCPIVRQSVCQTVNKSVNLHIILYNPVNQSVNQPVYNPVSQSVNQPLFKPVCQPCQPV